MGSCQLNLSQSYFHQANTLEVLSSGRLMEVCLEIEVRQKLAKSLTVIFSNKQAIGAALLVQSVGTQKPKDSWYEIGLKPPAMNICYCAFSL